MKHIKHLKKDEISSFFTIRNISTVVIISLTTYIFIYIENLLNHVFYRLQFLDLTEFVFWELLLWSGFILNLYLGIMNRIYRLLVIIILLVVSVMGIFFLAQINYLIEIKVIVIGFAIILIMGLVFAIKYWSLSGQNLQLKGTFLVLILISVMVVSSCVLFLPKKRIIIEPKTSPELIFFTSPSRIPNDPETLNDCSCNKISFMPSFGMHSLNQESYMERLKLAVENNVSLYINLIAYSGAYTHIDSAYSIIKVYKAFKEWFIENGIFYSDQIKAFTVDAEQPKYIGDDLASKDLYEGIDYIIENFPTEEEINNATITLQDFIDLVHEDGKQAGIIRARSNLDEGDDDGDIELMNRNIYSLDVEWDFSVTMLYRSQRLHKAEEGSTIDLVENLLLNIYGATQTETAFVYSRYYFYLFTGIEQTPGDINVKPENQYIFLGNYKAEFEETTYIEDKEFMYDLDICRHFGEEKVFLYNFEGFMYSFGEEGIEELIEHNNQFESWELEYYGYQTQSNLLFLFALVVLDPLLYLS